MMSSSIFVLMLYCDRCEAFSTYPRTYDWIHVAGLFTAESHRYISKLLSLVIIRPLQSFDLFLFVHISVTSILIFILSTCSIFHCKGAWFLPLVSEVLITSLICRCEMKDVLLEIDRILRPEGIVVLRDALNFRENAKVLGEAMRWKCSSHDTEVGPADTEGLLFCKKTFWESSEASTV